MRKRMTHQSADISSNAAATACGFSACLREKASNRRARPRSGLQRPRYPRRIALIRLYQFEAADNHRQQVVKIVGQAAGKLADGSFLAMQQRLLQPLSPGRSISIWWFSPAAGGGVFKEAVLRAKTLKARASSPSSSRRCRAGTVTFCSPCASRDIAPDIAFD